MGVVVGVPGMAHAGWLVSQFRSVPGETKRTGATAAPAAQRLSRRSGAVWRHTWPGVTWPWLRWRHNSGHVIREPPVTSPDWKPVQRAEKSATRSRRKLGNRAKLGNGRGGADGDPFHRLSTFFFLVNFRLFFMRNGDSATAKRQRKPPAFAQRFSEILFSHVIVSSFYLWKAGRTRLDRVKLG